MLKTSRPENNQTSGLTPQTLLKIIVTILTLGLSFQGIVSAVASGATGALIPSAVTTTQTPETPTVAPQTSASVITTAHVSTTTTILPVTTALTANAPIIQNCLPNIGAVEGGIEVKILGTNFNGITKVSFDTQSAVVFGIISSTLITAVIPPHSVGIVKLSVSGNSGTGYFEQGFTYVNSTNIIPSITEMVGATLVPTLTTTSALTTTATISQTIATALTPTPIAVSLTPAISQTIAITPTPTAVLTTTTAISQTIAATVAPTSIAVSITPAISQTVAITPTPTPTAVIMTPAISKTAETTLTPTPISIITPTPSPLPNIFSINPKSGSVNGGTIVTIIGTNFNHDITKVTFGGIAANSFKVSSETELVAEVPAHLAGTVPISVVSSRGSTTLDNGYTFIGTLTMTIAPGGLNYYGKLTGNYLMLSANLMITVNDTTGSASGWNLQARQIIPKSDPLSYFNLMMANRFTHFIQAVTAINENNQQPINTITYPVKLSGQMVKIYSATGNTGTGQTNLIFNTQLVLPPDTPPDKFLLKLEIDIFPE